MPMVDAVEVYSACISGVSSHGLAERLVAATAHVQALALQYIARANTRELHRFPSAAWGNDDQVIFGDLTKGELTDLYTNEMVKRTQLGRPYYDRLMLLAPLGKCPFCGFGSLSEILCLRHTIPPKELHAPHYNQVRCQRQIGTAANFSQAT